MRRSMEKRGWEETETRANREKWEEGLAGVEKQGSEDWKGMMGQ